MAPRRYEPPQQGRAGQLFDTVFIVALVYLVLFAPLILGLTGGGTYMLEVADKTWAALGQNAVMIQQWEKLGFTPETAADLINKRFDYTINPIALALTGIVVVGYFWFVVRFSEKEYREVIAEKFDQQPRGRG